MQRRILLNPGPCTTSDAVKAALVMPDLCPREPEFAALLAGVRRKLADVGAAGATHRAVLLAGSGTLAVEAALASLVGPDDTLLLVENGAYGRRAVEMAEAHGLKHRVLRLGWTDGATGAQVAAALGELPAATHCFVVHHETTTGLLNPLAEIVAACRARGVATIVDAMSSFGGLPLDLREVPADCVVSSANKCLQGLPGLSFVLIRPELLTAAARRPRRGLYLDLPGQWRAQEETGQFLYTPPVQVLHALDAALDELFAEGLAGRQARYAACHAALQDGMARLGFEAVVPERWQSRLLTAYREPADPRWSFAELHDDLAARGITIYPGKVPGLRSFRLATLGDLRPADIAVFLDHLTVFLRAREITPGATSVP
jgi:2-aminoethylphosphonate aminotransferase